MLHTGRTSEPVWPALAVRRGENKTNAREKIEKSLLAAKSREATGARAERKKEENTHRLSVVEGGEEAAGCSVPEQHNSGTREIPVGASSSPSASPSGLCVYREKFARPCGWVRFPGALVVYTLNTRVYTRTERDTCSRELFSLFSYLSDNPCLVPVGVDICICICNACGTI